MMNSATRFSLQDLNNEFCYRLDHCLYESLIELFTQDATYIHGTRKSFGRDQIETLFTKRQALPNRTSRHIQTGLILSQETAIKAFGHSTCITFVGDGRPPIARTEPFLVADFSDEYEFCSDNRWRISSRIITRIFVAPDNAGPVGQ